VSNEPRVLDHTALVALFAAERAAFEMWELADRGEIILVFPSAAMAEASHLLGADDSAWRALLLAPGVRVSPLDQTAAIGSGRSVGTLVVRQVVYEARAVRGAIVTRAPWQYPADAPPLRSF
jgi:hypothetical protein